MPDFLLFAQHGWADNGVAMNRLARGLATPETVVVVPTLGYIKTWLRIEPLIETVQQSATATLTQHPDVPVRVVGHSMGGLIWLELLHRHREWWPRIESLVLIASPVGGADLGRIFDPLGWGIGIAHDLGRDRRALAEEIAATIPVLVIAGDSDGGSDGTIPVDATRVRGATFVCLPGIAHPSLRDHPSVVALIRHFWSQPHVCPAPTDALPETATVVIERLRAVPGMTSAHNRGFHQARESMRFKNGVALRTWKNPAGVDHIFVTDSAGHCLFAGFVGWIHADCLRLALAGIQRDYRDQLL